MNGTETLKWVILKDESERPEGMKVNGPQIQKWDKGLRLGQRISITYKS